jgi:hypothetical protein
MAVRKIVCRENIARWREKQDAVVRKTAAYSSNTYIGISSARFTINFVASFHDFSLGERCKGFVDVRLSSDLAVDVEKLLFAV